MLTSSIEVTGTKTRLEPHSNLISPGRWPNQLKLFGNTS